jgi:hypothetical protein
MLLCDGRAFDLSYALWKRRGCRDTLIEIELREALRSPLSTECTFCPRRPGIAMPVVARDEVARVDVTTLPHLLRTCLHHPDHAPAALLHARRWLLISGAASQPQALVNISNPAAKSLPNESRLRGI